MGSERAASSSTLRERVSLGLLLLVGAGAIAVGLYQAFRAGVTSWSALADVAVGASVLLVSWLFLAPSAWPVLFGDRPVRSPTGRRPSRASAASPPLEPMRSSRTVRAPAAANAIPRWADPLVHPRMDGPVRPVAVVPAAAPRAAVAPIERPRRMASPERAPSARDPGDLSETLGSRPVPAARASTPRYPRWDPELPASRGPVSSEVLEELDRIETELRNFVPLDPPPVAAESIGLEDLVD